MPHAQAPLSYVATAYSLRNSAPISASHVQQRRALLIFIPFSASFLDRLNLLFTLHLFYSLMLMTFVSQFAFLANV